MGEKQKLVLVGAGHAHLLTLTHLRELVEREYRVTVISPTAYHYYSGMGPGMLSGTYLSAAARFHVHELVESQRAAFIRDRVTRIDSDRRVLVTGSGREVGYDVVSFNVGSGVPLASIEIADGSVPVLPVKPVVNYLQMRKHLIADAVNGPLDVAVVGGGPAGVETAGNLALLFRRENIRGRVILVSRGEMLDGLPSRARSIVRTSLREQGIEVLEGVGAERVDGGQLYLGDGSLLSVSLVVGAMGVRPPPLFRESGLPVGDDDGLLVNDCLQSVAHPEILGGGDCVTFERQPLAKVGVFAVRQNEVLHDNLRAVLDGDKLREFSARGEYLLILNMGDGRGVAVKGSAVHHGRFMFWLKDFIDTRFVGRYQLCGEAEERGDELAMDQ